MAATRTLRRKPPIDYCRHCDAHPELPCGACNARRREIYKLVEERGHTIDQAAERLRLSVPFASDLLAEEHSRLEQINLRRSKIDNKIVRDLYEIHLAHDPDLTISVLTRRAGFDCPRHVSRMLGYKPTSDTSKGGKRYAGRVLTTISIENASRLLRALGYTPAELARGVIAPDGTEYRIEGI